MKNKILKWTLFAFTFVFGIYFGGGLFEAVVIGPRGDGCVKTRIQRPSIGGYLRGSHHKRSMMNINAIPEPWRSFLSEIDASLKEETSFHCIGGFVIAMLYGFDRTTADVDVILIDPRDPDLKLISLAGKGSELHKKYGVYLDRVTVAKLPIDYDERLTEMFPGAFSKLRLFAVDPYDLALSKIERNIERDVDDVMHLARTVPLDLDILQQRYHEELRPDLFVPAIEDLTLRLWIDMIEEDGKI